MKKAAMNKMKAISCFLAVFFILPAFPFAAEISQTSLKKPRAVSLDYCADQFLLSMADRDQIMALTSDAVKSHSFYRDKAKGLHRFNATTEEILHKSPDIVIRYWGGFKALPFLEKVNISVTSAHYGTDPKVLYENMRLVGAALDQKERAEDLIQDYQKRLQRVRDRSANIRALGREIRVAYLTPGGFTAGQDTFINNIFKLAGLSPLADELGLTGWQPLPLEGLITNPPDLIIGSFFDLDQLHVSSWSLSRHDRIKKMLDEIPTIIVPGRYLSCNGIFSVDAAEYIQQKVEARFITPVYAHKKKAVKNED